MVLDRRWLTAGIATLSILGLASCQDNDQSWSRSEIEQIAADFSDDSELRSEVAELQTRIDQLEQHVARIEEARPVPASRANTRTRSGGYRLIGGAEPLAYSSLERCLDAKTTIEDDHSERQEAAGGGVFFAPPQLSCVEVG